MIIVTGTFLLKGDKFDEGLKLINDHIDYGIKHPGCIEGFVTKNKKQQNEILLYTKWEDEESYNKMSGALKRNPKAAMDFLKLMNMLEKQPQFNTYEIIN